MFELIIEYANFFTEKLHPGFEFQVTMYLEEGYFNFKQIYQSRRLNYTNELKTLPIHERFSIQTNQDILFLKAELKITNPKNCNLEFEKMFLFYKTKDSIQKFNFEFSNEFRLEVQYKIITSTRDGPLVENIDSDTEKKDDDSPSFIELIKITKVFMKKVTPVRKLQWFFEKEIARKKLTRDLKIVAFVIFHSYFATYFYILIAISTLFKKVRNKYREYFLESVAIFFKKEDSTIETNNNLIWIKESQLMVIKLSNLMKNIICSKTEKSTLFLVFKNFTIFMILIGFVHIFSWRQFLVIFFISGGFYKYKDQIEDNYPKLYIFFEKLFFSGKIILESLTNKIKKKGKAKIVKYLFFHENESKNFNKFDNRALPLLC